MDDIDDRFAGELRRLRDFRGIAQDELGRRAGLSSKFVGQIERQERGTTLRNAARIAEALGVTLEAMIAAGRAREEAPKVSDDDGDYGPPRVMGRIISTLRQCRIEDLEMIDRLLATWREGGGQARSPSRGGRGRK